MSGENDRKADGDTADDVSFETENDADRGGRDAAEVVKKLKEKLAVCEKERQEYLDGWQRAKADLVNARKRDEEERREFVKFANEQLVGELLPVLESFEMAMGNRAVWEKADKNWRTGVEYIYSQLKKALADSGVEEINPVGQKFDPALHEPAEFVSVDDEKNDRAILAVIQKGHSLNGKVLKAPKVRVGEYRKLEKK
ncbi:MAG: molecular chaperone GrpE [Parcubacteria group bacterium Gr01-1014_72]|nr:MAG: molecular chaperone GrpE [Parcubacteria group bacterium Gr01-1014_72]